MSFTHFAVVVVNALDDAPEADVTYYIYAPKGGRSENASHNVLKDGWFYQRFVCFRSFLQFLNIIIFDFLRTFFQGGYFE
jgi:hypothetical protein